MPEAGEEARIYTVPPGWWEERGARGAQTGEFINVAPRCQPRGGVRAWGRSSGPQCCLCSTGPLGGQHQTGAALRRCPRPLIIFTPISAPPPSFLPNGAPRTRPRAPGKGQLGARKRRGGGFRGRVGTRRHWRRWRVLQRWLAGTEMRRWGAHGAGGGFVSLQPTMLDRPFPPVPAAPSFWRCLLCHSPHVPWPHHPLGVPVSPNPLGSGNANIPISAHVSLSVPIRGRGVPVPVPLSPLEEGVPMSPCPLRGARNSFPSPLRTGVPPCPQPCCTPLPPPPSTPGPNCASGALTMPLQWHIKGAALAACEGTAGTGTAPRESSHLGPPLCLPGMGTPKGHAPGGHGVTPPLGASPPPILHGHARIVPIRPWVI